MALAALGLTEAPVHEPVHDHHSERLMSTTERYMRHARSAWTAVPSWSDKPATLHPADLSACQPADRPDRWTAPRSAFRAARHRLAGDPDGFEGNTRP